LIKLRKIGLVANPSNPESARAAGELADFIRSLGMGAVFEDVYSRSDAVIVLGGDGSVLRAAPEAAAAGVPLMGVNMGNLGFLTDVGRIGAEEAILRLKSGDFRVEKRAMLSASVMGADYQALNDVCAVNTRVTGLVELELLVNDERIDTFRADGVIVATPTGSTAYNFSAGGPILKPDARMMVITPICPHTFYARPFVVPADDVVVIVPRRAPFGVTIAVDGWNTVELGEGRCARITRSTRETMIIKTNKLGFYDVLRQKMAGGFRHEAETSIEDSSDNKG
jgi:NAD+ kinase